MTIETEAFMVALRYFEQEQAKKIIATPGGVTRVKIMVVGGVVAAALMASFKDGGLVVSGRYFYDMNDFINAFFIDYLKVEVAQLSSNEVCATCTPMYFSPKDLICISGNGMKDTVELSIERLVYKSFLGSIDTYMESESVTINHLVIGLDAVYKAIEKTCKEAAQYIQILEQRKNLLG
jgi:preprotein translocase subunit Sec61beta